MSFEMTRTQSSRKQQCSKCGAEIPARTECVKYVKKLRDRVSLTRTWYVCDKCERGGAATMREILFRGKRKDNGERETGSLVVVRQGCMDERVYIADKMTGDLIPVDPAMVGQYTGYNDKNGVKIFEGDICKRGNRGRKHYEIVWRSGCLYALESVSELRSVYHLISEMADIVVIGNIHDNAGGAT